MFVVNRSEASKALLRQAGLRLTPGRVVVLDVLAEVSHIDALTVSEHVAQRLPTTSLQSVHNILSDLTQAGLVHKIEPAGMPALYERRVGDNHHHIVCTSCGAVADVDCAVGSAPCLTPNDFHGFTVQVADIVFWGLCPDCQQLGPTNIH
ncbi:MAG: transcriptional repressor [Propionibacteriaceae bacterium]|nr:transcriptional repressor [Propionibacteriaceae bacterium]